MSRSIKRSLEIGAGIFIGGALIFVAINLFWNSQLSKNSTPFQKTTGPYEANSCINMLRQIDAAANQFALEHNLTNGAPINFPNDLTPYIKLDKNWKIPSCPQGGIYHISKVGESPTCSLGTTVTSAHVLP
jgi:hypothetical protein